jgi:hypothetical protein
MTVLATTPAERQIAQKIAQQIAGELGVRAEQVTAAVELLDGGATVPFIARYRKEATGVLDDAQLRTLEDRLRYLRELEERRATILESIREQGKLDDALEAAIRAADSKSRNAAPRRRSPRRRAWSRSPISCSPVPRTTRTSQRHRSSMPRRTSPMPPPPSTAPAPSWSSASPRMLT